MKEFINKFKYSLSYVASIIVLSFVFTALEFIGVPYIFSVVFLSIINFALVFIYSLINGYRTNLKGYISGFRSGVKIWFILLIINLITFNDFNFKVLFYYFILMFVSIIGGIFGKNKQKSCSN